MSAHLVASRSRLISISAHLVLGSGGGNSATGFDDLHVLDTSWRWSKLERAESGGGGGGGGEDSARDEAPPGACEGAAMASSGGMLLLCGGYSSGGATRVT